jgi:hypothetical protein
MTRWTWFEFTTDSKTCVITDLTPRTDTRTVHAIVRTDETNWTWQTGNLSRGRLVSTRETECKVAQVCRSSERTIRSWNDLEIWTVVSKWTIGVLKELVIGGEVIAVVRDFYTHHRLRMRWRETDDQ